MKGWRTNQGLRHWADFHFRFVFSLLLRCRKTLCLARPAAVCIAQARTPLILAAQSNIALQASDVTTGDLVHVAWDGSWHLQRVQLTPNWQEQWIDSRRLVDICPMPNQRWRYFWVSGSTDNDSVATRHSSSNNNNTNYTTTTTTTTATATATATATTTTTTKPQQQQQQQQEQQQQLFLELQYYYF